MKIVPIVKSTSPTGEVKYFLDHLQAIIDIKTNGGDVFKYDFKPDVAYFDGSSYFALNNKYAFSGASWFFDSLTPNIKHNVYATKLRDFNAPDFNGIRYEIHKICNTTPDDSVIPICVGERDEGHYRIYKIEEEMLPIQKVSSAYETTLPVMNDAITRESLRKNAEYKQGASLYGQRNAELERAKKIEREKLPEDLAALASDAMDFSQ